MDIVHCLRYISLHHVLEVGSASIIRSSNNRKLILLDTLHWGHFCYCPWAST